MLNALVVSDGTDVAARVGGCSIFGTRPNPSRYLGLAKLKILRLAKPKTRVKMLFLGQGALVVSDGTDVAARAGGGSVHRLSTLTLHP